MCVEFVISDCNECIGGNVCGRIAQSVERRAYTSVVPGSSPGTPTIMELVRLWWAFSDSINHGSIDDFNKTLFRKEAKFGFNKLVILEQNHNFNR